MTTPKAITFIVVGGLAIMAVTYMLTLSACVLFGLEPKNEMMRSMEAAGMYVLGAFTGVLVNTRSQQPETQDARSNTNSNVHSANPDTNPKPHPTAEP